MTDTDHLKLAEDTLKYARMGSQLEATLDVQIAAVHAMIALVERLDRLTTEKTIADKTYYSLNVWGVG